ncbi:MAG: NUDIX domain-containing protein [Candidatus Paceibacteria bacterium]
MSTKSLPTLPNCFYRVSIKGLILNEQRSKFLIGKDGAGFWELPGGGLEWGETPQNDLAREVEEEMHLAVTEVASQPCYFLTGRQTVNPDIHIANIVYECQVAHFNFTPTNECLEIQFVDAKDILDLEVSDGVRELAKVFDPKNHSRLL